ncbi:MAG: FixH family protein [Phycisphaerales bacterium]|nr:FixH family protein [Phycisphaerales bacterium]
MLELVNVDAHHRPDGAPRAPSRGRFWPLFIVGLIVAQFSAAGALIWYAVTDPTFAIEPNYYQKALKWDETARQLAANRALGWKPALEFADQSTRGTRVTRLQIVDRTGASIDGATVSVESFFHADAGNRSTTALPWDPDALAYVGTLPIDRGGVWEMRFEIVRGEDRFTFIEDRYLP